MVLKTHKGSYEPLKGIPTFEGIPIKVRCSLASTSVPEVVLCRCLVATKYTHYRLPKMQTLREVTYLGLALYGTYIYISRLVDRELITPPSLETDIESGRPATADL